MTESEMVAKALIEYRDNPPVRRAGTLEGRWYETGDIMGIVMAPVVEFTTHEYITRLAALMLGLTSRETEYLAHSVWAARSNDLGRMLYRAEKHAAGIELENELLRSLCGHLHQQAVISCKACKNFGTDACENCSICETEAEMARLGVKGDKWVTR